MGGVPGGSVHAATLGDAGGKRIVLFEPGVHDLGYWQVPKDPWELNNLAGRPESAGLEFRLRMALTEWMLLERDYLPLPAPDAPRER